MQALTAAFSGRVSFFASLTEQKLLRASPKGEEVRLPIRARQGDEPSGGAA